MRFMLWIVLTGCFVGPGPVHAAQAPAKPHLHGLLNRGRIDINHPDAAPNNALDEIAALPPGIFGGVTINVKWRQVEPAPGKFDSAAIDSALAEVRAYNSRNPAAPLGVKLRVWQGDSAPDWVKSLGGPPVSIVHRDWEITVGRYWSTAFRQAWHGVQDQLAARYDNDPLVREVTDTSCSSVTDEPFVMNVGGDAQRSVIGTLLAAGYSDAAYQACLTESAGDYAAWRRTSIELPVGEFRRIASGRPVQDQAVTAQVIAAFRGALGDRAILSNHALAAEAQSEGKRGIGHVVGLLRQFGPPVEFQTANPRADWLPGGGLDWDGAMRYAVSLGAGAVELWDAGGNDPGFSAIPPRTLASWSRMLQGVRAP